MQTFESFTSEFYPQNDESFAEIALRLFHFQAEECPVYRDYLKLRRVNVQAVNTLEQIPFLPIELFRTHEVQTGLWTPEQVFTSSGTTGQVRSRHLVHSLTRYENHAQRIFERSFGPLTDYHMLFLLPSYLERTGSSLVAMAAHFIRQSNSPHSGFYLDNLDALADMIESLKDRKVFLLGVSFALLDLAERYDLDLRQCVVMETGGMKGRRKEITREELHRALKENLHLDKIASEYGMTELMSQAYSQGDGMYQCPPSMRVQIRDLQDPCEVLRGRTGRICVIDLANAHSCAFLETQDLGVWRYDGYFEVLGRMDNAEIRGCNLLVE